MVHSRVFKVTCEKLPAVIFKVVISKHIVKHLLQDGCKVLLSKSIFGHKVSVIFRFFHTRGHVVFPVKYANDEVLGFRF